MKVTPDTNVLVRFLVRDDPSQAAAAQKLLSEAALIVLTIPTLCELSWVLSRAYRLKRSEIAEIIGNLIESAKVAVDRRAVEAGLALLVAGADFADGVIAYQGTASGADVFASFDKRAVRILAANGDAAVLVS